MAPFWRKFTARQDQGGRPFDRALRSVLCPPRADRPAGAVPPAPGLRPFVPPAPANLPTLPVDPAGPWAGHWQPIVVDRPALSSAPRPPSGLSYRPDTVCDGWTAPFLDLRLASVRGYAHRYEGRPRQDDAAAAFDPGTGVVAFAVADGLSSAREPHVGAQLACRSAVDEILGQVCRTGGFVEDWLVLLKAVAWQLIEQARRVLRDPHAGAAETADLIGTTLVAGTATPTDHGVEVAAVAVGDSGVWWMADDRITQVLGGGYTGSDGVPASATKPLPHVPSALRPRLFNLVSGTVVLIGTDGFGDPLGDGQGAVADLFLSELLTPIPALGFAHLLDFSRGTFDDDRTLIALWPHSGFGEAP